MGLEDMGIPSARGSQKKDADMLETFVGGILQESGYDAARAFVKSHLVETNEELLRTVLPHRKVVDPKKSLKELLKKRNPASSAEYSLVQKRDRYSNEFVSSVSTEDGSVLGQGMGSTIKAAEKAAAIEALDAWYLSKSPRIIVR